MSRVKEIDFLRLDCFGHIHGGYGMQEQDGVLYFKCRPYGPMGGIEHAPVALRMNPAD